MAIVEENGGKIRAISSRQIWIFDVLSIVHSMNICLACVQNDDLLIRHTRITIWFRYILADFKWARFALLLYSFYFSIVFSTCCVRILRNLCKSNCYFGLLLLKKKSPNKVENSCVCKIWSHLWIVIQFE